MEYSNMKKIYIIPATEVVEIKTHQLIMASTMDVNNAPEITDSEDILSREFNFGIDGFGL